MANANEAYRGEKSERLAARISRDKKSLCEKAAINSVVEAAKRTIQESESMALTQPDRAALVEALSNAPAPNDRLRRAAERRAKIFAE